MTKDEANPQAIDHELSARTLEDVAGGVYAPYTNSYLDANHRRMESYRAYGAALASSSRDQLA